MRKTLGILASFVVFAVMGAQAAFATDAAADDGKKYTLEVKAPTGMVAGAAGEILVTVTPIDPWKVKTTTPYNLVIKPTAGVTTDKPKYTAADFVDKESKPKTVKIKVTAAAAGQYTVNGDLKFFACTDATCQQQTTTISATFTVAAK